MLQVECLPGHGTEAETLCRFDGTTFGNRIAANPVPGLRGRIDRARGTIGKAAGMIRVCMGQHDGGRPAGRPRDRANPRRSRA